MGTRNITKMIYGGELKVCQYGQWDGYPATALHHIVEFLKDQNKVSSLLEVSGKINLLSDKAYKSCALPDADFNKIFHLLFNYSMVDDNGNTLKTSCDLTMSEKINYVIIQTGMDKLVPFRFLLETRDTGYQIFDVLTTFAAKQADSIPLLSHEPYENSWDIEARNTVDFDQRMIHAWWHGKERHYSFDQLPTKEELLEFEKEGFEK